MPIIPAEEVNLLHANVCQAVADPTRIRILYALSDTELHVTALADALEIPQSTVSRHLALLRQRSLVTAKRQGATVVYKLANPRVIEILDMMRQLLRETLEKQTDALE